MKSNLTAIAACVHCRTILVCSRQVLFHPLAEERDLVRTMLGNYWFHHSRTRFDGQFHRCAGPKHEHEHGAPESTGYSPRTKRPHAHASHRACVTSV